MKPPRCPKCRKFPESYIETSEAFQVFEADANGVPESEGYNKHGDIIRLIAACACGHKWMPLGITQVTQIDGYQHPYGDDTGGGTRG